VAIFVARPDQLRYTHPVHQSDHAPAINPAGPQRSPKTGQWGSPENRPTRM